MQQLPKFCLLLWMVFNSITIHSQAYKPMAVESATWIVTGYGDYNLNGWAFRIEGDTTINQTLYKKLLYYHLDVQYDNQTLEKEFSVTSSDLMGFMRDDIVNRKVYLLPVLYQFNNASIAIPCRDSFAIANNEILLFDFDITVGDISNDCMVDFSTYPPEVKLDTTINIYGEPRRVLGFSQYFYSHDQNLIEGVGYTNGLLNEFTNIISAVKGYGLYSYCIGSLWDCRLSTSTSQLELDNETVVYPNPVYDEITLETNKTSNQIQILNFNGKILTQIDEANKRNVINISFLRGGNYFIKIIYPDSSIEYKRFIKM